jgi:hypothetical protein
MPTSYEQFKLKNEKRQRSILWSYKATDFEKLIIRILKRTVSEIVNERFYFGINNKQIIKPTKYRLFIKQT